ncbi:unnamed protein product, partial [Prorocentrum cordatum]
ASITNPRDPAGSMSSRKPGVMKAKKGTPMRARARSLGAIVESDSEMESDHSWEKLPEVREMLAQEAMSEQEIMDFLEGKMKLPAVHQRWRHLVLKVMSIEMVTRAMQQVARRMPSSFTESFQKSECPHPPWAVRHGSNATSVYAHCTQCSDRLFLRNKTAHKIFEAQKKREDRESAKRDRQGQKELAKKMMENYRNAPKGGKAASISASPVPPVPHNLYVLEEEGYVKYKSPPPSSPAETSESKELKKAPPGSCRRTALSDMKYVVDSQKTQNEHMWKTVQDFIQQGINLNHDLVQQGTNMTHDVQQRSSQTSLSETDTQRLAAVIATGTKASAASSS